jgi:hypothetical protein
MATFRKRGRNWQVQVRRKGHPPATATFALKSDAQRWAREQELAADSGHIERSHECLLTVGELLERYQDEIAAKKRGKTREAEIIRGFKRSSLATCDLDKLSSELLARHRDERLATVSRQR